MFQGRIAALMEKLGQTNAGRLAQSFVDAPAQAAAAREAAAFRMRQAVRPMYGRTEGAATSLPEDMLIPKTPLDAGLMMLGAPGRAAKLGGMALGAALQSSDAEAGPLGRVQRAAIKLGGAGWMLPVGGVLGSSWPDAQQR